MSNDYKNFIKENLQQIIETFDNGGCSNLRTFIFFLDIFEKAYKLIIENGQYKEDFLKGYMLFTIIYSIEYKNDGYKRKLKWFVEYLLQDEFSKMSDNVVGENDNTFMDDFQKYTEDCLRSLMGSTSIANYIQYGGFDESKFKEEIEAEEKRYELLNKTEHGKILNKMMDWRLIGDDELDSVLDNVERFLNEDKYTPDQISTLFARYLHLKQHHINCRDIDETIFFDAVNRREYSLSMGSNKL